MLFYVVCVCFCLFVNTVSRGRLDTEEPQDPEALQVWVYRGRR